MVQPRFRHVLASKDQDLQALENLQLLQRPVPYIRTAETQPLQSLKPSQCREIRIRSHSRTCEIAIGTGALQKKAALLTKQAFQPLRTDRSRLHFPAAPLDHPNSRGVPMPWPP